uniref:Uncharacterized protein n=1 Tax=Meloidogyne enterolobii TaxID=390850 RepID=A0A6V7VU21_MELEN|nr:unnamed protein product [Meloidogyne enterolobii]
MTESLSNSVSELELSKQIENLIKLHTEFNNLQKKFDEEKKKNGNLEGKNKALENELNEMNKKIQKTNTDNENKIGKINSDHQNEIKNLNENIQQLKTGNTQKDEKINSLEKKLEAANELYEKKFCDLTIKLNNEIFKYVDFVQIKNKWKEIDSVYGKCCDNNCINTNKPVGNCIIENGFGNLINDENIKYILGKGYNCREVLVYAENLLEKPQNIFKHSLYYFEITCKLNKGGNCGHYMKGGRESFFFIAFSITFFLP